MDKFYSELCYMFGISETDWPYRIVKIETGSLIIDLLGSSKIIEAASSLITRSAEYLYRRFTIEGKIASIPRTTDAIESILDLRQKLTDAGIDTAEIDQNIQKATHTISRNLNVLLGGEAKVTVNDEEISVGTKMRDKFIEARTRLALSPPSSEIFSSDDERTETEFNR